MARKRPRSWVLTLTTQRRVLNQMLKQKWVVFRGCIKGRQDLRRIFRQPVSFLIGRQISLGKVGSSAYADSLQESTAIPVVDVNGGLVGQWNDENPMKLVRSHQFPQFVHVIAAKTVKLWAMDTGMFQER